MNVINGISQLYPRLTDESEDSGQIRVSPGIFYDGVIEHPDLFKTTFNVI